MALIPNLGDIDILITPEPSFASAVGRVNSVEWSGRNPDLVRACRRID
jgi:hypothetical protein